MSNEIYTDCPECPECGAGTATPFRMSEDSGARFDHLLCAACGHDWIEEDVETLCKAWFAVGAWEQKCAGRDPKRFG